MNMKLFYSTILLLLVSFTGTHASSNYHLRTVNYSEGLSNLNIKSIYQDSLGFMWFGTKNRLNRFDGVTMRTFDCYDKEKNKRDNNINAIAEASQNFLWLGTDNGVFIFNMEDETFHFFDYKTEDGVYIKQWVADIWINEDQNIWITVPNQGVFKFNQADNSLKRYDVVDDFQLGVNHPECMTIDDSEKVWVGSNGSGVYLYDQENDTFKQYLGNKGTETLLDKNIYTISTYKNQVIVGIHEECIMLLNPLTNTVKSINIPNVDYAIIRHIVVYDSKLWIATQNGLYSLFLKNGTIEKESLTTYNLRDKYIEYVYQDKEGGIWIGTRYDGINLFPNHGDIFEIYAPKNQNIQGVSNRIKKLVEDDSGNIWVGTEDAGLLKFDQQEGLFQTIKTSRGNKQPLALMRKENEIWIGYFKGGMDILSLHNNYIQHFTMSDFGIGEESLFVLFEDKDKNVWMGNGWKIYMQAQGTKSFTSMDMFGTCYAYDIFQDSEGYIWIATLGNGVFRYNPEDSSIRKFTTATGEGLPTNLINSVSEDYKGQLWFSTDRGGICVYNKKTDIFRSYSIEHGLPDDITYKILEDKDHLLWFGTNKGLVCFNPATEDVKIYTEKDGLPSNTFNTNSALISSIGKLYMGTMEGLIAFQPHDFQKNSFVPDVYITELFISGESVTPNSSSVKIEKSVQLLDNLTLSYEHSNVSIGFASLSYTSPNSNIYAYMLEDVDKNWIYTKENKTASYANLKPGVYTFKVKGTNNDGVWSDKEKLLSIEITPPWWRSNLALILYSLLFILSCYFIMTFSLRKYKRKNIIRQRLFEVRKEKELYEAKLNFFTEIAHEIRTPVTLISAPLESILEEKFENEKIKNGLNIIKKNTNLLLSLINQLLDFRKIDSERFIINITKVEVIEFIDSIISRFKATMEARNLLFSFDSGGNDKLYIDVDKEGLDKIISNLLSNAIKYSETNVSILIDKDDHHLKLQISNDGQLIPEECRDKLFEPFFRVKNPEIEVPGSGLGLSLAKSLAEILNGYVYYDSKKDKNNFYLKVPLNNSRLAISELNAYKDVSSEDDTSTFVLQNLLDTTEQKRSLLIVEDNPDMLEFLVGELSPFFQVDSAQDGEEAINILDKKNFDIVLSDIMMPKMNGLELCTAVKENDKFKHIIVILLTARNDLDSKIHALNVGVDAYVEKPFSIKYIVSLIESLEKNRQTLISNYTKDPSFGMRQNNLSKNDVMFLKKVIDAINTNISDPNFNVERLAEMLNYSRSSLHRRIKVIIDHNPVDLIRIIRLQKAIELIKEGEYRINEISYLVGISSPSYFVKLFQKQYNMTPNEYKNSLKEKN